MGRKPLLTLWEQEKRRLQPLLLRFTTNLTIYGKAGARCASLIDCEMGGLWGAYLIMLVLLFEVVILGAIEQKKGCKPAIFGQHGRKDRHSVRCGKGFCGLFPDLARLTLLFTVFSLPFRRNEVFLCRKS